MITPLLLSLQIDSMLGPDHGLTHAVKSKKLGWRNLTMEMIRAWKSWKGAILREYVFSFHIVEGPGIETCFCFLFLFKLKPFRFVLLLQYITVPLYILVKSLHPHQDIHKMFSFQVKISHQLLIHSSKWSLSYSWKKIYQSFLVLDTSWQRLKGEDQIFNKDSSCAILTALPCAPGFLPESLDCCGVNTISSFLLTNLTNFTSPTTTRLKSS